MFYGNLLSDISSNGSWHLTTSTFQNCRCKNHNSNKQDLALGLPCVLSKWTVWIKHFNLFLDSEFHQKANKFEWTLGDIRLEKIISTPIWTIFLMFQLFSMLEIVPSCNLVQYKENWWCNFEKMATILILDPIWSPNIFLTSFTSTNR